MLCKALYIGEYLATCLREHLRDTEKITTTHWNKGMAHQFNALNHYSKNSEICGLSHHPRKH